MRLILLPGMDGTGLLFKPILEELPNDINIQVITYPISTQNTYADLTDYVWHKIQTDEEFVLVAESFSGPIAYSLCTKPPKNLKLVIFVATFLTVPNKILRFSFVFRALLTFKSYTPKFLVKYLFFGNGIDEGTIALFKNSIINIPNSVLFSRIKAMASLEHPKERIPAPCAYLHANNDKLISKNCLNEFKALCPNINIISQEGPHFILQAKPKECAKILAELVAIHQ